VSCPDCGHRNPPGATSCEACNYPLQDDASADTPVVGEATPPPPEAAPGTPPPPGGRAEPVIFLRRPRRRERGADRMSLTIWLFFGVVCAVALLATALVGYHRNNQPVIEGASESQQQRADSLRAALAKDSTNVAGHIALANILYDTGNWPEAIRHYDAAIARDSTQVNALVDLGVAHYNLSQTEDAERIFQLAIRRDPHQAVALFNLGIVAERREDWEHALQYFHRAMESDPPDAMRQPLVQAMQQAMAKTGAKAPSLPDGR
jgi:tetratricopeptide (TPR) repeat protein